MKSRRNQHTPVSCGPGPSNRPPAEQGDFDLGTSIGGPLTVTPLLDHLETLDLEGLGSSFTTFGPDPDPFVSDPFSDAWDPLASAPVENHVDPFVDDPFAEGWDSQTSPDVDRGGRVASGVRAVGGGIKLLGDLFDAPAARGLGTLMSGTGRAQQGLAGDSRRHSPVMKTARSAFEIGSSPLIAAGGKIPYVGNALKLADSVSDSEHAAEQGNGFTEDTVLPFLDSAQAALGLAGEAGGFSLAESLGASVGELGLGGAAGAGAAVLGAGLAGWRMGQYLEKNSTIGEFIDARTKKLVGDDLDPSWENPLDAGKLALGALGGSAVGGVEWAAHGLADALAGDDGDR